MVSGFVIASRRWIGKKPGLGLIKCLKCPIPADAHQLHIRQRLPLKKAQNSVDIIGRGSPMYTDLRQHTKFIANENEHEQGDHKRRHILASLHPQSLFHQSV